MDVDQPVVPVASVFSRIKPFLPHIATAIFIVLIIVFAWRYFKKNKVEAYTKGLSQDRSDGAHDYDVRAAVKELQLDHNRIQNELTSELS